MKKIFTLLSAVLVSGLLIGQSPSSFKYQAVLRNIRGDIRANADATILIEITKNQGNGAIIYSETHKVKTDNFGLIDLEIGNGTPITGIFSSIDWSKGTYFVNISVDGVLMGTAQLHSVPYALYAEKAGNGFSGNYNDLINRPVLFDGTWLSLTGKPTTIAGYGITDAFNGTWTSLTGKPTLTTVATSGSYTDLINRPALALVATTGSYTNLTNLPTLTNGTVTSVSGTSPIIVATGTTTPVISMVQASETTDGYLSSTDWTTFNNKSSFDGTYGSLVGKPTGNSTGDLQYWNGTDWVLLPRGNAGQVLTINSSNIPFWQNASAASLVAPNATSQSATSVLMNTATLNGSTNANGFSTTVTFEYGITTSYGSTTTATQSPVTGFIDTNVSKAITTLLANTTYHFRLRTSNAIGITYSSDMTFLTSGAVPTATTTASSGTTTTGTTLNGTVNANGFSSTVTFEYGLTISYGSNATATPSTVTGSTSTNVSASISGLAGGTTYHYRVNATNSLGTTNGSDMTFTTLGALPTATTTAITGINTTGATVTGTVNANLLSTTVSFEYGLTISYGSNATATPSTVTGSTSTNVSASISGLAGGTTYHYRVNATNSLGTTNGSELTFTTAPANVNDIDGNTYNVIAIGTQVWMAENLKTTKYNDNSTIPLVTDASAWAALTTPAYCWYNNDEATYKATYGALYNWYTVDAASNGGKNVCPTGWHVSTDAEWTTLTTYLGGGAVAGGKLKETGTTHWLTPNTGATNENGFTALPGGYHNSNGYYGSFGDYGYWWSSTEYSTTTAWYRDMYKGEASIIWGNSLEQWGLSVRCVRDF